MAERTDQLSRGREATDDASADDASGGGRLRVDRAVRSRVGGAVRSRVGDLFSARAFLVSLVVLAAGLLAGGAVVDAVGGLLGMLVGGVVLGLATGRVVEAGTAGGVVGALSLLLWKPVLSMAFGFGVPVAVVGAGSGLLVAALGAYLGGDVRDGMTREL